MHDLWIILLIFSLMSGGGYCCNRVTSGTSWRTWRRGPSRAQRRWQAERESDREKAKREQELYWEAFLHGPGSSNVPGWKLKETKEERAQHLERARARGMAAVASYRAGGC